MSLRTTEQAFANDVDLTHQFVHGLETDTVLTDNGPIPTLANVSARAVGYYANSVSSVTIALGNQSFEIEANKKFQANQTVQAVTPGGFMVGQVVSYTGTTLVVDVTLIDGAGTAAVWAISLTGAQGAMGPQGPKGDAGVDGAQGIQGVKGDKGDTGNSAYQDAVIAGFVGTEADWLASLKGAQGLTGNGLRILGSFQDVSLLPQTGNAAGDAYIIQSIMWVWDSTIWSPVGQTGPDGKSAYQAAKDAGLIGPTVTLPQWIASLQGSSAYQVAVANGFVGTTGEWLASLVGAQGPQGPVGPQGIQGVKGDQANSIKVLGAVADTGSLPATGNTAGDAYFIGTHLWVWDGGTWIDIGAIVGPQGPAGAAGAQGSVGPAGPTGQSAYQAAYAADPTIGTEATWIASLKGKDGDDAYTVAVNNGFVGTKAAWLASLIGPVGPQGLQGAPGHLQIKGALTDVSQLPVSPADQEAYTVNADLYVYIGSAWVNLGPFVGPQGPAGPDGAQGPQGIQGIQGIQGVAGANGANVKILGVLTDSSQLPATGNTLGDAYRVADNLYTYNGAAWIDAGLFRGPQGDIGPQGNVGSTGAPGAQGPQGIQGPTGPQGIEGPMGPGVQILGTVATSANLPASSTTAGDMYVAQDTLHGWAWTGSAWTDVGPIQGPQGVQGIQGPTGPQGIQGIQGDKGDIGARWISLGRDPGPVDGSVGDFFINSATLKYYQKVDATTWGWLGYLGGGNVYDAPSDDMKYVRLNAAWTLLPVDEAPVDTSMYVRKAAGWVALPSYAGAAPNDVSYYVQHAGGWTDLSLLTNSKAPNDTGMYVQQGGGWVALPASQAPAPTDGAYYLQKAGAWVTLPAYTAVAPNDTSYYVQHAGGWVDLAGLINGKAPNDTNYYVQQGGSWVQMPAGAAPAPSDGNAYVQKGGAWTNLSTLVNPLAPNDTNGYVMKGGAWVSIATLAVPPAPNNTNMYVQLGGAWAALPSYAGIAPNDTKYYVQHGGAWVDMATVTNSLAPNDTNYYVQKGGAWVQMPASAGVAPSDGKYYVQKDGAWVADPLISAVDGLYYVVQNGALKALDRYDLKVAAATTTLDLSVQQVFTVDTTAARTLTFANGPGAGRTMTAVVRVSGNTNGITWPSGINWSGGAGPVLGASFTVVVLLWDGTSWYGVVGASA